MATNTPSNTTTNGAHSTTVDPLIEIPRLSLRFDSDPAFGTVGIEDGDLVRVGQQTTAENGERVVVFASRREIRE